MKSEKDAFDESTAERMEYEFILAAHEHIARQKIDSMRDVLKKMRFALNALTDGCPDFAIEILGDTLRTYGEEQP